MNKKLLILPALLLVCFWASAQSVVLNYRQTDLPNNGTIIYTDYDDITEVMMPKFNLKNTTAKNIILKLKRTEISVIDGSENSFCAGGSCYLPSQDVSSSFNLIADGMLLVGFYADYKPLGNEGISTIKYELINQADTTDATAVTIKFDYRASGIKNTLANGSYIYASQNNGTVLFTYDLPAANNQLVITNVAGQVLAQYKISDPAGTFTLPMNLNNGVYIYTLVHNLKVATVNKFIVTR